MAGVYDLQINQGETFNQGFQWCLENMQPVKLYGYTGICQIKANAQSTVVLASPIVIIDDADNGKISLAMTAEETASIPVDGFSYRDVFQYVYDVKLISPLGEICRVINGYAYVSPGVTK